MKDLVSLYGEWAFVAGGAEGLGAAFSSALSAKGMNLVLCDVNASAMNSLADGLEMKYNIKTIRLHQDLSGDNAFRECMDAIKGTEVRLFVYVPAFSPVGKFAGYTSEELDYFLSLNIRTPVHLIHEFLHQRKNKNKCGIILMSSLAGLLGPALVATYAASKAFQIVLSESLFYELKADDVDIIACCAGPVDTPTYRKSNPVNQSKIIGIQQPEEVAAYALKMLGKKPICIAGWKNRMFYFILTRILPRKISGYLVSKSMLRMYPN